VEVVRNTMICDTHDIKIMVYNTLTYSLNTRLPSLPSILYRRVCQVHLNPETQARIAEKTGVYSKVYKNLTGKDVAFEFPKV
jgi:hypothetical protein